MGFFEPILFWVNVFIGVYKLEVLDVGTELDSPYIG
jgi:hypothetical protein